MKKNLINILVFSALAISIAQPLTAVTNPTVQKAWEFTKRHKGKLAAAAIAMIVAALGFAAYKAVESQEKKVMACLSDNRFKTDEMSSLLKATLTLLIVKLSLTFPNDRDNEIRKTAAILDKNAGRADDAQFLLDNKNGIQAAAECYKNE